MVEDDGTQTAADTDAPRPSAPRGLAPGDRLAHFRIEERLGAGGMGIVYRARDEKLGREVALKVLPADVVARTDRRDRFLREARAAAAVVHPAIATVFEVGADGDVPYIAMELIRGRTLRALTRPPAPTPTEIVRIAITIAEGLARAHKAGVVHRDLKPDNVMLDADGAPKILDFGIARVDDGDAETQTSDHGRDTHVRSIGTPTGAVVGTPLYMSPEQARGLPVDGRSDLFSFGTMLFELLCGRPPFAGRSAMDVASAILRDPAPPPSSIAPELPAELDRIVLKCLEKEPRDRYQSAADLAVDLRGVLKQTESGAPTPAPKRAVAEPAPARARRPRRWLAAIAVAAVAAVIAVAIWIATRTPDRETGDAASTAAPPPSTPAHRDVTTRMLTATTSPGPAQAAISPDGKTLALARDGRLVLQDVATGAIRDLPPPTRQAMWITWYPDGKALLMGFPAGHTKEDLITQPIDGSAARPMPVQVWGASFSHDGTRLVTFDDTGIRVSALDGTHAQLLVAARQEAELGPPCWSPGDRWIAYSLRGPDLVPRIRAVAVDGSTDVVVVEGEKLETRSGLPSYDWLADGRLIYAVEAGEGSAIRSVGVDLATGRGKGAPSTIISFPDQVGLDNASDGGTILFSHTALVYTRYHAPLGASPLVMTPEVVQGRDPIGTSLDRRTTYFVANDRPGRTDVLAVADGHARVVASLAGSVFDPTLTPDAAAVMYLYVDDRGEKLSLRRVAIAGGEPVVVEELPYAPSKPVEYTRQLVAQLACARQPGRPCVLGAAEGHDQVFYEVDPAKGRGRRIGALTAPAPWVWALSPDGARLVVTHRADAVSTIDVASGETRKAVADPQMIVFRVAWIGGTRSFVASGETTDAEQVVRFDPNRATTLWTSKSEFIVGLRVADDGGRLDVSAAAWNRNFGIVEER